MADATSRPNCTGSEQVDLRRLTKLTSMRRIFISSSTRFEASCQPSFSFEAAPLLDPEVNQRYVNEGLKSHDCTPSSSLFASLAPWNSSGLRSR